jgi:LuxR family maltose regulon positive regulatory protein
MVPRVAVLERLERAKQRPITLISAPAGFGKSVLASMWLSASGLPGGWASLDESDNDLNSFVSYLLAAIKTALPQTSFQTDELLSNFSAPSVAMLARSLLKDLDQVDTPFIIVLDDIHHIHEESVFSFLEALLKYPSPVMHLVLAGRQDPPLPIASWRAYRQITEIRQHDLRFVSSETAQLIQNRLGIRISADVADEWTRITEGWITALQLFILSLRHHPESAMLSGIVIENSQFLHEFLLAEVLSQLSPIQQACLFKISLLDRFNAQICEIVCREELGDDDGFRSGEDVIRWLQESNLFLINLDPQNRWVRFHHLFQSYLRELIQSQLPPEAIASLHLRASRWYAENSMVSEAIREALVAGDKPAAEDLVYHHRYALMEKANWNHLDNLLRLFPDEYVRENVVLLTTAAINAYNLGRLAEFLTLHQHLEDLLASLPSDDPVPPSVLGEVKVLNNLNSISNGSAADIIKNAEKSLELLPSHAYHLRSFALGTQIVGLQMEGRLQEAESLGRKTIDNLNSPPKLRLFTYLALSIATYMEGELVNVLQYAGKLMRQAMQTGRLEYYQGCYFKGVAHYFRNELEEAETCFLKLTDKPKQTSLNFLAFSVCGLLRIYHSQKRSEEALLLHQKTRALFEDVGSNNLEILDAFQVEMALSQDGADRAHHLSLTVNFDVRPLLWFHYIPQLVPLKLLIHQGGKRNLEEAQRRLIQMDEKLRKINLKAIRIDVLAMQALLLYAQDDLEPAYQKMGESLALAVPGGFIRNYLEFGSQMAELLTLMNQQREFRHETIGPHIVKILEAFPSSAREVEIGKSDHLAYEYSPLTKREREVLEYLATDLSTREIAEALFVTWSTIRTHFRSIYAKLDVHGRYEAVQRAKDLEII